MSSNDPGSGSRIPGEIRVEGMLRLAPDTLYEGDVHAPGGLVARPGSIVAGDVYTDGAVRLAATARIGGRVRPTSAEASTAPSSKRSPAGAGCLERLLALADEGALRDEHVDAGLAQLGETLLEEEPAEAWPFEAVQDALLGRGLARLAPVTIEQEAEGGFVLRIRREGDKPPDPAALVTLARRLSQAACPGVSLHPLSSASTPGDVVLLVRP